MADPRCSPVLRARLLLLVALALSLIVAVPLFAGTAAETAREFLLLAYDGRLDALPKAAGEGTLSFERRLRSTLRVRCVRVENLDLREIAPDAIEAHVTLRKSERQTPEVWAAAEVVPLRLRLARDGERWLVSAVEFPDDEFAGQLMSATVEERAAMLRAQPERMTRGLARAVYALGMATFNYSRGGPKEVSRRATAAAALTREIAIAAGDRGGEALALGIESIDAWMQHDDLPRGVRLSREVLRLAEESGEPDVLARAWYNLGRAIDADTASRSGPANVERVQAFHISLTFAERGEDPTVLIRILTMLGLVANAQHCDHLAARQYAERVLTIAREAGDVGGEINGESLMAAVYIGQRDDERALFHHERALRLAQQAHSRLYHALLMRSASLKAAQGRDEEARAAYMNALTRDERGAYVPTGMMSRYNVGRSLLGLARLEEKSGNLEEAECLTRQAGVFASAGHPDAYLYLRARSRGERGEHAAALRLVLASLAHPQEGPGDQSSVLERAARTYLALGDTDRALITALEALEIVESIHGLIGGAEQQQSLESDEVADSYQLAAEIALERNDPGEALAFLERGRARMLTSLLDNGRRGAIEEADAVRREAMLTSERELVRLSIELDRARAGGDGAAATALMARLGQARVAHESLADGVAARSQRLREARRQPDFGGGLTGLVKRLPAGMAAIEYLVTEEELHAFVLRKDASGHAQVLHRRTRVAQKSVEERVNGFVEKLAQRDLRVVDAARDLYELLLAPIENDLAGVETLLVIPDDVVWRVPFATLVDRRGRYLVESAAVVYAPSVTAFTMMVESSRVRRPSAQTSFFAVGNPKLAHASKTAATSFYRDATLNPLPDAEQEVDAVGALYQPHALVLKGEQATETRIKSAMGEASVVHFATHALLDNTHPMYSRLALANDGAASDDGWLESWEIARLDLDADMVVLSACETARGQINCGEGVVGMAWSFFLAGARSTVATQWKIASESTSRLMVAFHRSLRAGTPHAPLLKAQALRAAQLELLRDPESKHPFHWGAFVLIGDPAGR